MEKETLTWRSPKTILLLLIILGITATIVISILRDRITNQQFRQVTVTGQGKISYEPDLAIVTLGVQIDKAKTADLALKQLNDKMAKIMAAVYANKIPEADISTSVYSLSPQYDYKDNVSVVSGYNANEQLIIKVRNYDKDQNNLNKIISVATLAGANQVSGLAFDVSNVNDLKQAARIKAIGDAKAKAQVLATAAGVKLKDISSWYENVLQVPSPVYAAGIGGGASGMGGGGGLPQTPSGLKEIIIEMNLTYNLK
ncbi:MAG: SIMPL domain-containing protein [Candidatus Falkowbacteria bacterium]